MVDYCHKFRAYKPDYEFPSCYYPLANLIESLEGPAIESWEAYVNQVRFATVRFVLSVLKSFCRLLLERGLRPYFLKSLTMTFLVIFEGDTTVIRCQGLIFHMRA